MSAPGAPGVPDGEVTVDDPGLGRWWLRPVRPESDTALLHRWLTDPKSSYWLMGDATPAQVTAMFRTIDETAGMGAHVGHLGDEAAFLTQTYDPARHEVVDVHAAEPGDVGMHVLVAPTDRPVHGFTLAVMRAVMDLCFTDPATRRVVVEPDDRNTAVHALNAAVGFEVVGRVPLPGKTALLSVCTREQYRAAAGERPAPATLLPAGPDTPDRPDERSR